MYSGVSDINNWSGKKVLVTGAGGFIGSHLTEHLVGLGANTRAFVRYNSHGSWGWLETSHLKDQIEVIGGDLRDPDSLSKAMEGMEIIFHLAALISIPYSYSTPLSYLRNNVEGTVNLLQSALHQGVELVVHTSTSEVYGTALYVPMDESHPLRAQSPYSASKISSDAMVQSFHHSYGLPVSIVRPFNTFGPRQSERAVIPAIISQALTQQSVNLGNLSPTRDFNYVLDTVEGFIKVAEGPSAEANIVNIGSGHEISIGDLANVILSVTGKDIPIIVSEDRTRPVNSEVDRLCADSTQARSLYGWKPSYSLEEGIIKTIDWINSNSAQFKIHSHFL